MWYLWSRRFVADVSFNIFLKIFVFLHNYFHLSSHVVVESFYFILCFFFGVVFLQSQFLALPFLLLIPLWAIIPAMQKWRNMKASLFYIFLWFFFSPWTIFFFFLFSSHNLFLSPLELKTAHLLNLNCNLSVPTTPWEPLHSHSICLCVSLLHLRNWNSAFI